MLLWPGTKPPPGSDDSTGSQYEAILVATLVATTPYELLAETMWRGSVSHKLAEMTRRMLLSPPFF